MGENLRKIDKMTNRYPVQKTLRARLIPIAETEENFLSMHLLESDTERKINYGKVKKLIDAYHRGYIEDTLSSIKYLDNLKAYAEAYYGSKGNDELKHLEEALRKEIVSCLSSSKTFEKMFKKEMITELLPEKLSSDDDLDIVNSFAKFTTYFTGFFQNRKNMYSSEEQSTAIAFRCINDNLPKHLDNVRVFQKALELLSEEDIQVLNDDFVGLCGTTLQDIFTVDYFIFVLAQSGINRYNEVVGGYTTSDGTKIKGINEYINLYNQKADKSARIPNMKQLYKQILSEQSGVSFIPAEFESDNELIHSVYDLYNTDVDEINPSLKNVILKCKNLFSEITTFDLDGIYIQNDKAVTNISNEMLGSWFVIRDLWYDKYDRLHLPEGKKKTAKYEDKKEAEYKNQRQISIGNIQMIIDESSNSEINTKSVCEFITNKINELTDEVNRQYDFAKELLSSEYNSKYRSLKKDENSVMLIKNFLDSIKALELFIKPFVYKNREAIMDDVFYGKFLPLYDVLRGIDKLYDKVRNYVTKKPYSTESIKINFDNPQLLGGWDKNKEKDYRSVLFRKDNKYYLGIMDKSSNRVFEDVPETDSEEYYEKMVYKLLPGPNKMLPKVFFAKSNIEYYAPDEKILEIYKKGTFKKGKSFSEIDCHRLIDFYKQSLRKHLDWSEFGFDFKKTEDYCDIGEFYKDVKEQGYKLSFNKISSIYIDRLVSEGKLYLFQIYNKDFSEYSNGTPSLHTLYLKMLFDETNLKDVVYQLNGGAEMFYRPASITDKDRIIHNANEPINNKNPHTEKKQSVFDYDIEKDRRFTKNQFFLHFPITLNFKAVGETRINDTVRQLLKDCEDNYVIGIDRGERHLLYISVINSKGEIVEQYSMNDIVNEYNGKTHLINYHELLDKKEEDRLKARQNWTAIENIKELKEGYISQVVNVLCKLVLKYDAIIVMEDLNSGFKRGRIKVEKQVYQKFEKMLIDKLNFYVDKHRNPEETGGLLNALQLTNKFESFKKMGLQNGFIFYIPAWLTSKIDPVTGFVDLLKPHYKNIDEAKDFISRFDSIRYNADEDYFEFKFNYDNFLRGSTDFRKKWTVCTYGDRIKTFRNPEKNSEWDNVEVHLIEEFIGLFKENSIDYKAGELKHKILNIDSKKFYEEFIRLLNLTLQMRNSKTKSDIDYLISPVKDKNGVFYDSRNYEDKSKLPSNADANGAYNIARKGLWAIEQIKKAEDISKVKLSISNKEWLEYAQREDMNE